MQRLIDANKLTRYIKYSSDLHQRVVPLAAIETSCATTCKDCKHGRPAKRSENGDIFCTYWVTDDHDKDGFCEKGERP